MRARQFGSLEFHTQQHERGHTFLLQASEITIVCVLCNHTAFSKQTTLSWSTPSAVFSCPRRVQVILSGHSGNRAHCGIVYRTVSSKHTTDIHGCSEHYEWVVQFCYVELEYMSLHYEQLAVIMHGKWQYRKVWKWQYTRKESVVDTAGLAHPHSQDSLLPTRYLLMNTGTDSRVKWWVENFSQCVWRAVSAASKRPGIYSEHAEKWCLRVCTACREIHTNHDHSRNHKFLPNFQNNCAKFWRVKILNVIGIISQKDNVNNHIKSQLDATIIKLLLLHLVGLFILLYRWCTVTQKSNTVNTWVQ